MLSARLVTAVKACFNDLGYAFFEDEDGHGYDLNLIGVRSSEQRVAGFFDDAMMCIYKAQGIWRAHVWPVTTDPGLYYLQKKLLNPQGCAILAPGQYRSAWKIGKHFGRPALVQVNPVKVFRDGNRDKILDWDPDQASQVGLFGINIHDVKNVPVSELTKTASAGCQVFAFLREHVALMNLANKQVNTLGANAFTYTLIESSDLDRFLYAGPVEMAA